MRLSAKREALRARRVVRTIREEYKEYRWWRFQDEEPPEGYLLEVIEYQERVYPPPAPRPRKPKLQHLSLGKLKARLFAAGVRNPRCAELAHIIYRREIPTELSREGGRYVLGWPEATLREFLGRRLFQKVTRGVARHYIVLDEFGYYAAPGFAEAMQAMFRCCRKYSGEPLMVTQELPAGLQLPYTEDQRTSALATTT